MLEKSRALLVQKYREYPQGWPEGIDGLPGSGNEQWYRGHEHEWTGERIEALLDPRRVSTPPPVSKPVSRKEYMRELMRKKRAEKK